MSAVEKFYQEEFCVVCGWHKDVGQKSHDVLCIKTGKVKGDTERCSSFIHQGEFVNCCGPVELQEGDK
jgi:hypothetical protein